MIRSNLKAILDERGLSIRKLAAEIEVNFELVRRLYNDETDRYPRELLTKICDHLGIEIGQLLVNVKEETGD
jgi:DNA-binding Xre family transcriptional regulator